MDFSLFSHIQNLIKIRNLMKPRMLRLLPHPKKSQPKRRYLFWRLETRKTLSQWTLRAQLSSKTEKFWPKCRDVLWLLLFVKPEHQKQVLDSFFCNFPALSSILYYLKFLSHKGNVHQKGSMPLFRVMNGNWALFWPFQCRTVLCSKLILTFIDFFLAKFNNFSWLQKPNMSVFQNGFSLEWAQ